GNTGRSVSAMNVFLFQSVPERFDLRQTIVPGKTDAWYATRYRNEMRPGDLVFFWMGGDEHFRGLYAWGRITSEPPFAKDWEGYGVDVEYSHKFKRPLKATSLREDGVLSEMLVFRAPHATNFLLTPAQAKRLAKVVASSGEEAPSVAEAGA